MTKPISFPLPQLQDVFDAMANVGPSYFTLLDLRSGYHQMPLDPATKHKSSFVTHSGQYQYLRLPFGLMNAPATFQALMATVFRGLTFQNVMVYIDDIVVYSQTWNDHMKHLKQIFDRLKEANLKLHPGKCKFGLRKILYLGHVMSREGIEVDKKKVELVERYPTPKNQKELRSFLGLAVYYRKFVSNFSKIATPLHRLLKKDMEYTWDSDCEEAFSLLKAALTSAPVLRFPDMNKPFILNTDGSTTALGHILSQEDEKGIEHPICFGGRSLSKHEKQYSVSEIECAALISAVREFHVYLANNKFIVYTDHLSLKLIHDIRTSSSGRLLRWSLCL